MRVIARARNRATQLITNPTWLFSKLTIYPNNPGPINSMACGDLLELNIMGLGGGPTDTLFLRESVEKKRVWGSLITGSLDLSDYCVLLLHTIS